MARLSKLGVGRGFSTVLTAIVFAFGLNSPAWAVSVNCQQTPGELADILGAICDTNETDCAIITGLSSQVDDCCGTQSPDSQQRACVCTVVLTQASLLADNGYNVAQVCN